jgi:hypothetical protein
VRKKKPAFETFEEFERVVTQRDIRELFNFDPSIKRLPSINLELLQTQKKIAETRHEVCDYYFHEVGNFSVQSCFFYEFCVCYS